jgi:hypothetical protein
MKLSKEQVTTRGNHGPSHFMQLTADGLITAKSEYSFQAKGIPAIFLVAYMPDSQKPYPQRLAVLVKDGTRCDRSLTLTIRTANLSARSQPSIATVTGCFEKIRSAMPHYTITRAKWIPL